jgi:hypothetical protein
MRGGVGSFIFGNEVNTVAHVGESFWSGETEPAKTRPIRDAAVIDTQISHRQPARSDVLFCKGQFHSSEFGRNHHIEIIKHECCDLTPNRKKTSMHGIIIAFMLLASPVAARDFGQWEAQLSEVRQWFQKLMQPDFPTQPCCGEADAYWAASFEVDDGRYVAIITDERSDSPLLRPHREVGERVVVPNNKIKWDEGNPTGHGIIFLGTDGHVYCYERVLDRPCARGPRHRAGRDEETG